MQELTLKRLKEVEVNLLKKIDILKKSSKEVNKLAYHTLYCWYAPLWFFMSFQNVLFMSVLIISGFLLYYIIQRSFTVKQLPLQ